LQGDEEGDGGKSDDDDTPISLAMATVTRVAVDEESDGGKSKGDDEKGCGRALATATKRVAKRAMARAARVMVTPTKRAIMARKRASAKSARAMAMARKMGRATRVMATATKRAMVRKRARAFVILSSECKINAGQHKKSVLISGPSQITNHKFAIATHKRK
jgi:hypothetical protein